MQTGMQAGAAWRRQGRAAGAASALPACQARGLSGSSCTLSPAASTCCKRVCGPEAGHCTGSITSWQAMRRPRGSGSDKCPDIRARQAAQRGLRALRRRLSSSSGAPCACTASQNSGSRRFLRPGERAGQQAPDRSAGGIARFISHRPGQGGLQPVNARFARGPAQLLPAALRGSPKAPQAARGRSGRAGKAAKAAGPGARTASALAASVRRRIKNRSKFRAIETASVAMNTGTSCY